MRICPFQHCEAFVCLSFLIILANGFLSLSKAGGGEGAKSSKDYGLVGLDHHLIAPGGGGCWCEAVSFLFLKPGAGRGLSPAKNVVLLDLTTT